MWLQLIFIYFITKNDKTLNKDCSVWTGFKQVHLLVFFWPFYLHLVFFISLFQTIVYFPVMSFVICLFFKCQTHIKDAPFVCFYTFFDVRYDAGCTTQRDTAFPGGTDKRTFQLLSNM